MKMEIEIDKRNLEAFLKADGGLLIEVMQMVLKEGKVIEDDEVRTWTSASERLPKRGDRVIVTQNDDYDEHYVYVAELRDGFTYQPLEWADDDGCACKLEDVLAWMPLPKPYNADKDGD